MPKECGCKGDDQELFLMEFLVDRVNIPSVRAIHDDILPVTTSVTFQILNLPLVTIDQDDSADNCTCLGGDTQIFRKGKSCLFALPGNVVDKPVTSFPVTMSVNKRLPPGVLPDVMLIGSHQIQAHDMINYLLSKRVFNCGHPCKTLKDTYKIATATGQCVGEVTVFIRASCFGKKIVTQFQIPHNKKPYLFKGTDNSPVFQCKKIPSNIVQPPPVTSCDICSNANQRGSGESPRRSSCPAPPASRAHPTYCSSANKQSSSKESKSPRVECLHAPPEPQVEMRGCGCAVKAKKKCSCGQPN